MRPGVSAYAKDMSIPTPPRFALPTLLFVVFLNMVGFGIVIPLLPFYAEAFHASPAVVAALFSVYSLGMFISEQMWGKLSDRIGRKPVLLITLTCNVACYAALAFANTLALVFVVRLLAGLLGGNISTCQAYVADVTPPEMRAKRMGLVGAAFGMGFVLGPAIGGFLAHGKHDLSVFQTPMLAASGMSALAVLATLLLLKESNTHVTRQRGGASIAEIIRRPVIGRIILASAMMTCGFSAMEATFGLWAERHLHIGPREIGLIFSFIGIVVAVIQGGLIGRIVKRLGEHKTLILGFVCMAVGLATLPLSPSYWIQFIPTAFMAAGMALASPSINALLSLESGVREQGRVIGVNMSLGALARIAGPLLGGGIFTLFGPGSSFWLAACFLILGLVVVFGLHPKHDTVQHPETI